jgi:ribosome biogenesis GTPase / thiamine phosphate phosphatase
MVLEDLGWNESWTAVWSAHRPEGGEPARVSCVEAGSCLVVGERGEQRASLAGRLRHHAVTAAALPATGDWVAVRVDDYGSVTIEAVLPRSSAFVRRAAGPKSEPQVVAANVDALFVVAGLDGDFNPRRLERTLVLAHDSGTQPVIVLNKADLCREDEARERAVEAAASGAPVHVVSALLGTGLDALAPYLGRGRTVGLVGSSGAGKSSLANRLLGEDRQATAAVRASDDRGRHTTTRRELLRLPAGGCLIDTPGLRELQLWVDGGGSDQVFEDLEVVAAGCRFRDCHHQNEPGCALLAAVTEGRLDQGRLDSLLKLGRERSVHRLAKRFRRRGF